MRTARLSPRFQSLVTITGLPPALAYGPTGTLLELFRLLVSLPSPNHGGVGH